jgi:putative SOS response-associated peptidase YedK
LAVGGTADAGFLLEPFDPGAGDTYTFSITQTPTVSAIPEPETYAMLLAGLAFWGLLHDARTARRITVGMLDVQDRRPAALEPEDALRWMNLDTPIEEATHIARTKSLPTEQFVWWQVDRAVNRVGSNNNSKHLLVPVSESA